MIYDRVYLRIVPNGDYDKRYELENFLMKVENGMVKYYRNSNDVMLKKHIAGHCSLRVELIDGKLAE